MANNKRDVLIQEFFETLTTMNRLLGDNRSLYPAKKGERRKRERRQPQTELLYFLSRTKEMTIKAIAEAMYITSSAATQMVENLVQQGLLERLDDPNDRRVVRVTLTPLGRKQFASFKKTHISRLDELLKNLTSEELKFIINIRNKALKKISK